MVVVVGCEVEDDWMVESDGAARRGCDGRSVAAALLWQAAAVKVLKRCSMVVVLL